VSTASLATMGCASLSLWTVRDAAYSGPTDWAKAVAGSPMDGR
jgi:hypothetical protein